MKALVVSLAILMGLTVSIAKCDDFKPEEGFTLLFNGKDLTGWKTTKGESLDAKSEAYGGRFKVKDGILTIDPSVKGDVRIVTTKEFAGDVHIKFDFMPDAKCNNDLYLHGLKYDLKKPDVKNMKEDEWNAFEVILKGEKAEFKNNGESMKTQALKGKGSVFEIRPEFGSMQLRRLRAKEGS